MKGSLIVFEGLDCSGKTTAIYQLLDYFNEQRFVYSKGIGSKTRLGKLARKIPSTLMFSFELLLNSFRINSLLKKGKIVLQDRYDISISSYVPSMKKSYNRIIIKILKIFLRKPDVIIYFHLPLEERIKRLKEKNTKYELMLAENPKKIIEREKEYEKWFEKFYGEKIRINTGDMPISEVTSYLGKCLSSLKINSSQMHRQQSMETQLSHLHVLSHTQI